MPRSSSPARSSMSMVGNMPVTGKRNADFRRNEAVSTRPDGAMANRWPSDRILKLLGIDLPIVQAPMAGATTSAMATGVAQAGGLGSIPAALLSLDELCVEFVAVRAKTPRPINLNFF